MNSLRLLRASFCASAALAALAVSSWPAAGAESLAMAEMYGPPSPEWLLAAASSTTAATPESSESSTVDGEESVEYALAFHTTGLADRGDIDRDGDIDADDLQIILANYGKSGSALRGDLNRNGVVDEQDVEILLTNFGEVGSGPRPAHQAAGIGPAMLESVGETGEPDFPCCEVGSLLDPCGDGGEDLEYEIDLTWSYDNKRYYTGIPQYCSGDADDQSIDAPCLSYLVEEIQVDKTDSICEKLQSAATSVDHSIDPQDPSGDFFWDDVLEWTRTDWWDPAAGDDSYQCTVQSTTVYTHCGGVAVSYNACADQTAGTLPNTLTITEYLWGDHIGEADEACPPGTDPYYSFDGVGSGTPNARIVIENGEVTEFWTYADWYIQENGLQPECYTLENSIEITGGDDGEDCVTGVSASYTLTVYTCQIGAPQNGNCTSKALFPNGGMPWDCWSCGDTHDSPVEFESTWELDVQIDGIRKVEYGETCGCSGVGLLEPSDQEPPPATSTCPDEGDGGAGSGGAPGGGGATGGGAGGSGGGGSTPNPDSSGGDNRDSDSPEGDAEAGHPIILATGEMYLVEEDLRLPGRGFDFVWERKYRSRSDELTSVGNNWTHTYDIYLTRIDPSSPITSDLMLHNGRGREDRYRYSTSGYITPRGFFRTLEHDGTNDEYILTHQDGGKWYFNDFTHAYAPGMLDTIVDRYGNQMTFSYGTDDLLDEITDTLGRSIVIEYLDSTGLIQYVKGPNNWLEVEYEYYEDTDEGGQEADLKCVTYPTVSASGAFTDLPTQHVRTWAESACKKYTYYKGMSHASLEHNLRQVILTTAGGASQTVIVENHYGTSGVALDRVIEQEWGGSDHNLNLAYAYIDANVADNSGASLMTTLNDRVGNVSAYYFDTWNRLCKVRRYTGRAPNSDAATDMSDSQQTNWPTNKLRSTDPDHYDTVYEWTPYFQLRRITYPDTSSTEYLYQRDLDDSVTERELGNLRQIKHHPISSSLEDPIIEGFEYLDSVGSCGCAGANFVEKYTDGRGNVTQYLYYPYDDEDAFPDDDDEPDFALKEIRRWKDGTGASYVSESFTYTGEYGGQLESRTLPDNGNGHARVDSFTYGMGGTQLASMTVNSADTDPSAQKPQTQYGYNTLGMLNSVTDPAGGVTTLIYNQMGQLVQRKLPQVIQNQNDEYQIDYYYDYRGYLVRVDVRNVDKDGVEISTNTHWTTIYEHDALGYVTRVVTEADKDGVNLATSVRTYADIPSGDQGKFIVTEYEYDEERNRTLVRYGEATNGNQPNNTIKTLYDERNLPFKITEGWHATDHSAESTTQYDYDLAGRLVKVSSGLEAQSPDVPRVATATYNDFGRMESKTDPMGNTVSLTYDEVGNTLSAKAEGELADSTSGSTSNVELEYAEAVYDRLNRITTLRRAVFEPWASENHTNGSFAVTTLSYTDMSQLAGVTDPLNNVATITYDNVGRRSTVTDEAANALEYAYDILSNVTSIKETDKSDLVGGSDQVFTASFEYDNLSRLVKITDNFNNYDSYKYDSKGNTVHVTDALGKQSAYTYDGAGRLLNSTRDMDNDGPDGDGTDIVTKRLYDDSSRLIAQLDDADNATRYGYDPLGRMIVQRMADGTLHQVGSGATWTAGNARPTLTSFTTGYDVHGNRQTVKDARGHTVSNDFDLLNRLTDRSVVYGQTPVETESYKYDGLSRQVEASDDDSLVQRTFNSISRLLTEMQQINSGSQRHLAAEYDAVGNLTTLTYPGVSTTVASGREIRFGHDGLHRISTIDEYSGGLIGIAEYDYVGRGRVQRRTYDAISGGRASIWMDYTYDGITGVSNPLGDYGVKQVVETKHTLKSGSPDVVLDHREYRWDKMYNKASREDARSGGTDTKYTYYYDAASRMKKSRKQVGLTITDLNYTLDGTNNRRLVGGTPSYPPPPDNYILDDTAPAPLDEQMNQYTETPFDRRSYDANGNLVVWNNYPSFLRTATYDYRNQMEAFDNVISGPDADYRYDALGRRTERVVVEGASTETTRYYYFGWRVVEEQDAQNGTVATYVYGNYIDEPLQMRRDVDGTGGPEDYYFHQDDMFNVVALTDANGNVVERYDYKDYGEPIVYNASGVEISGTAYGNPYLFNGRRYDSESGFYLYRTRYLEPVVGRFTTRDFIGIWGDSLNRGNAYAYVTNNPWTWMDPFGRAPVKPGGRTGTDPYEPPDVSDIPSEFWMVVRALPQEMKEEATYQLMVEPALDLVESVEEGDVLGASWAAFTLIPNPAGRGVKGATKAAKCLRGGLDLMEPGRAARCADNAGNMFIIRYMTKEEADKSLALGKLLNVDRLDRIRETFVTLDKTVLDDPDVIQSTYALFGPTRTHRLFAIANWEDLENFKAIVAGGTGSEATTTKELTAICIEALEGAK